MLLLANILNVQLKDTLVKFGVFNRMQVLLNSKKTPIKVKEASVYLLKTILDIDNHYVQVRD
jgi:hypothetical protein